MPEITPSKYLVTGGWSQAPHLSEEQKEKYLASTPPHLRDARSKGTPSLGSGAIYPIEESEITCDPFPIPSFWPVWYALDVGWKKTAAIWGAWDRESDCIYLWSEHYRGQAEPSIHAAAIRARAEWIPGVIDPAARGRAQHDGNILVDNYRDLGLNLTNAKNAVDSGIDEVFQRLSTGRLKVFTTMRNFLAEYRLYRRDEKGKIVKEFDHLMDSTRYLCQSPDIAITKPVYEGEANRNRTRNSLTGY